MFIFTPDIEIMLAMRYDIDARWRDYAMPRSVQHAVTPLLLQPIVVR